MADRQEAKAIYLLMKQIQAIYRKEGKPSDLSPEERLKQRHQEFVGDLCFKGPVKNYAVEIGYGVQTEQEGHGYTTEALHAMTQWAFNQKNVVFVEAETAPDNMASQRGLEKCGFAPDGMAAEGPRFLLESPPTNWSVVYMLFGMSIGMAIGHFQDQMVGMAIGMSLGVLFGVPFNNSEKKKRESIRQQRHQMMLK